MIELKSNSMSSEPPPLPSLQPQRVLRHRSWLFLTGGLLTAVDLLWCWACFSDEEGPGNGMALMLWLLIQSALVFAASLLILLGFTVTKDRPRWLGWLLLTAAWVPCYFWWQSGHLPFLRH